jgi:hypothetical protein
LCEALVRTWLAGRTLGPAGAHVDALPTTGAELAGFANDVRVAAAAVRDGWFGDRKVFVSAVWSALRVNPRWGALALDGFKQRLVAAHRAGALVLARADLVAAMDPELVAASEIVTDGASFHFLVQEPAR